VSDGIAFDAHCASDVLCVGLALLPAARATDGSCISRYVGRSIQQHCLAALYEARCTSSTLLQDWVEPKCVRCTWDV
jgi:hypothetical protein